MPSAGEIAEFLNDDCRNSSVDLVGDPNRSVQRYCSLGRSVPGALTFAAAGMTATDAALEDLESVTLICTHELGRQLSTMQLTAICVDNPRLAFALALGEFFAPAPPPAGVHASAIIAKSAHVDPNSCIGPNVIIGEKSSVGPGCRIGANSTILDNVTVGANVVIASGVVIGADGFGFERTGDGTLVKFPQLGGVVIGDDVEIGANTTIDRGTLDDTIISNGVRFDDQCYVAHNVVIGEHSIVTAQTMLAGGVQIGRRCWLAPGALVTNGVVVGDDAVVGLGAVVVKNVDPGQTVMGSPAIDAGQFRAMRSALRRLSNIP